MYEKKREKNEHMFLQGNIIVNALEIIVLLIAFIVTKLLALIT